LKYTLAGSRALTHESRPAGCTRPPPRRARESNASALRKQTHLPILIPHLPGNQVSNMFTPKNFIYFFGVNKLQPEKGFVVLL
jgi:hypothetical protein